MGFVKTPWSNKSILAHLEISEVTVLVNGRWQRTSEERPHIELTYLQVGALRPVDTSYDLLLPVYNYISLAITLRNAVLEAIHLGAERELVPRTSLQCPREIISEESTS